MRTAVKKPQSTNISVQNGDEKIPIDYFFFDMCICVWYNKIDVIVSEPLPHTGYSSAHNNYEIHFERHNNTKQWKK